MNTIDNMNTKENYSLPVIISHINRQTTLNEIVVIPRTFNVANECEIYRMVLEESLKDKKVTISTKYSAYTCDYWILNK
jgi:hypothetical protein